MSGASFKIAPLDAAHDRTTFSSDSESQNNYLREQITRDISRRMVACFVALTYRQRVAGYYTLASASLLLGNLPRSTFAEMPRFPTVPVVRMGHLAVDQTFKGKGLGCALLADALARLTHSNFGAFALTVDAEHDAAATFYRRHGFIDLPTSPATLFLPLATLRHA